MRKYLIIFLFFSLFNNFLNTSPLPLIAQRSEATHLMNEEYQLGGTFEINLTNIIVGWTFNPLQLQALAIFSTIDTLSIPVFTSGFSLRYGTKSSLELLFNSSISSPTPYSLNFLGPGFSFDFGFKKSLFDFSPAISYQFNGGINYNALPGADLIIKNAFLFGTNQVSANFTFSLGCQNSISFNYGAIVTAISPVFEFTGGFGSNFKFIISAYILGNIIINIVNYYYSDYSGNSAFFEFILGTSILIGKIKTS